MLIFIDMWHIATTRLIDLSGGALTLDTFEIGHLQDCPECESLLRTFKRQTRLTQMMLNHEEEHMDQLKTAS